MVLFVYVWRLKNKILLSLLSEKVVFATCALEGKSNDRQGAVYTKVRYFGGNSLL